MNAYGDASVYDGACTEDPTTGLWSAADDCTLREAIEEANANPGSDTIELGLISEPGFVGIIYLDRWGPVDDTNLYGDLDAYDSNAGTTLTIEGGNVTLGAPNLGAERILHAIPTGAGNYAVDLVIRDLVLISATEPNAEGGCVFAEEGSVYLSEVMFRDCAATLPAPGAGAAPSSGGGAIAAFGGLEMHAVQFDQSSMTNGHGGAIFAKGDLVADEVLITNSVATNSSKGGAIFWNGSGSIADISGLAAFDNFAATDGGGLYLSDQTGTVLISDSHVGSNTCTGGLGGGIFVFAETITMSEVVAQDNDGNRGGGIYIIPGESSAQPNVLLDRSSVVRNWGRLDAGGVFVHTEGGYSDGDYLIRNTTIGENTAGLTASGTGGPGAGLKFSAGALGGSTTPVATVQLQHCTIAQNTEHAFPFSPRALDMLGTTQFVDLQSSIVEGYCQVGTGAGGYRSLGSNVLNSGTTCPVIVGDATPEPVGTSLWGSGAAPILTTVPTPYYDNAALSSSINAATCPSSVVVDQIGTSRPTGTGQCDSGSIEQ